MSSQIELSVILSTYQRPAHLVRSLLSLSLQRNVDDKFEVIVSDDGSLDESQSIVLKFARGARFPVKWISHTHDGYRLSLCRNNGARASRGQYLLFTDGDCIFPPNHLQRQLIARRPGIVRAGECYRFEEQVTARIDESVIRDGSYRNWVSRGERWRLFSKMFKEQYYRFTRHPKKPKLTGYNIGISRADFETVNGFDESFVGWGCEDDDIAYRLRKAGRQIATSLPFTHGYHLWHPATPSRPDKWTEGPNVTKLDDLGRPIKCVHGLVPASTTQRFKRAA